MQFKISPDFIERHAPLTWREIEYGLQNSWIDNDAAVQLAISRVSSERTSSPDAINLASVLPNEKYRIPEIIHRLAESDPNFSRGKWLFLLLAWLFENRNDFHD